MKLLRTTAVLVLMMIAIGTIGTASAGPGPIPIFESWSPGWSRNLVVERDDTVTFSATMDITSCRFGAQYTFYTYSGGSYFKRLFDIGNSCSKSMSYTIDFSQFPQDDYLDHGLISLIVYRELEWGSGIWNQPANEISWNIVFVPPSPPSAISISPTSAILRTGDSLQFAATVYDQNGNSMPPQLVTWNSTIGSIDANGLFTSSALDSGKSGTVTANVGNISNTVSVSVTVPPQITRINNSATGDASTNPKIGNNELILFEINATQSLSWMWTVNGTAVQADTGDFSVYEFGDFKFGTYDVIATGINSNGTVSQSWTVLVDPAYTGLGGHRGRL